MATINKSSGQGRVRIYKSGRMQRCVKTAAIGRCFRMRRYVALDRNYNNMPDFVCDPCSRGMEPFVPKQGRVGQQKQQKGGK